MGEDGIGGANMSVKGVERPWHAGVASGDDVKPMADMPVFELPASTSNSASGSGLRCGHAAPLEGPGVATSFCDVVGVADIS